MVKELELYIGEERTKEAALKAIKWLTDHTKNKTIVLNNQYFVSEWSWHAICDGFFVYKEIIRDMKICDTLKSYCTCKNYRTYFPWDIYESEKECQDITEFKNSFGYDWDIAINEFSNNIGAKNKLGKWEES